MPSMCEEEVPEWFHLRQPLPMERFDPAEKEVQDAGPRLVGPEPVDLLAEHVRSEPASVGGEQRLELGAFRASHGLRAA
jgi:hypothetical protein